MASSTPHRDAMESALKAHLVPALRAKGFKGSFPHFRRAALPWVDYLTVQFNSAGGSFVVELATSGVDGKPAGYGSELPIEKLNVQYFRERFRLGSNPAAGQGDHWFVFGPKMYEPTTAVQAAEFYTAVSKQVLAAFEGAGEQWLGARRVAV